MILIIIMILLLLLLIIMMMIMIIIIMMFIALQDAKRVAKIHGGKQSFEKVVLAQAHATFKDPDYDNCCYYYYYYYYYCYQLS